MKAISLWQPWASAIACGAKSIETRSWSTSYRGPLAIHAAKRPLDSHARLFAKSEYTLGRLHGPLAANPSRLPFGAIIAVCNLVDVRPTEELELEISAIEKLYGDYSPGRFGWILRDVRTLSEPIAYRGLQGLFNVKEPVPA